MDVRLDAGRPGVRVGHHPHLQFAGVPSRTPNPRRRVGHFRCHRIVAWVEHRAAALAALRARVKTDVKDAAPCRPASTQDWGALCSRDAGRHALASSASARPAHVPVHRHRLCQTEKRRLFDAILWTAFSQACVSTSPPHPLGAVRSMSRRVPTSVAARYRQEVEEFGCRRWGRRPDCRMGMRTIDLLYLLRGAGLRATLPIPQRRPAVRGLSPKTLTYPENIYG